jgi:hypothetical protein
LNKRPTEYTHIAEKILIREHHLPAGDRVAVLVLGGGLVWDRISARHKDRKIGVTRLDHPEPTREFKRMGETEVLRYLMGMDPGRYDVVDIDYQGVPYRLLSLILSRALTRKVEIFCTVAFGPFGGIPAGLLEEIGYTKKMVDKSPELFRKKGLPLFLEWLAIRGVERVDLISLKNGRWNQLHFSWGKA